MGEYYSIEEIRKKYFPQIEKSVKNGNLSTQPYTLMKDRMLMNEGKLQICSSPIKNGKLYKLENPEIWNVKRQVIVMESLQDYLKNFHLEFNPN